MVRKIKSDIFLFQSVNKKNKLRMLLTSLVFFFFCIRHPAADYDQPLPLLHHPARTSKQVSESMTSSQYPPANIRESQVISRNTEASQVVQVMRSEHQFQSSPSALLSDDEDASVIPETEAERAVCLLSKTKNLLSILLITFYCI